VRAPLLLTNENWPRPALLDLLPQADWVAGHLVVVTGRSVRRRALPAP
jgi:hypothetical protein